MYISYQEHTARTSYIFILYRSPLHSSLSQSLSTLYIPILPSSPSAPITPESAFHANHRTLPST